MTTTTKLTVADLNTALLDERHGGWGYATAAYLAPSRRERLNANVVHVANELGLDYEALFMWANSKLGRWLVDSADVSTSRATVRQHLNAEEMARLAEAEALG